MFNLASQLLGHVRGHAVNSAVDGLEKPVEKIAADYAASTAARDLRNLGVEPTLEGAMAFIDQKIDQIIDYSVMSNAGKTELKAVIDKLFAAMASPLP